MRQNELGALRGLLISKLLLMGTAVWAAPIALISDPGNGMAAFALGDLQKALVAGGHQVVTGSSTTESQARLDHLNVLFAGRVQ